MPRCSAELRFDLTAVLRLAEDAAAASEHTTRWEPGPTLNHPGFDVDAGACLILVRDDGVYLMSTDKNAPRDTGGRVPRCYARGFDPGSGDWWSRWNRTGLPGDDFAEYLEVVESGLLDELRAAAEDGYRWFVITLSESNLSLSYERGIPPMPGERAPSDE
ncbi:DUF3085 domain-containing protein [Actinomadura sp. KC06]|uniref:DUF3085 domain-containing protein n=1 Tax=Actinomadura sp. KC06 TaxID=2530369 RepID=UPI00104D3CFB|nr:DUF3085 domain-containing protein [Actinomadura sp. KC06]TDD29640.1 DUF3085 domain-containing protein [Actinomadura sp. KC06]